MQNRLPLDNGGRWRSCMVTRGDPRASAQLGRAWPGLSALIVRAGQGGNAFLGRCSAPRGTRSRLRWIRRGLVAQRDQATPAQGAMVSTLNIYIERARGVGRADGVPPSTHETRSSASAWDEPQSFPAPRSALSAVRLLRSVTAVSARGSGALGGHSGRRASTATVIG